MEDIQNRAITFHPISCVFGSHFNPLLLLFCSMGVRLKAGLMVQSGIKHQFDNNGVSYKQF